MHGYANNSRTILAAFTLSGCTTSATPSSDGGAGSNDAAGFEAQAKSDGTDYRPDGNPADACAPCQMTLEQACSPGGAFDCPPALNAPGFYDWAQREIGKASFVGSAPLLPPLCGFLTTCHDDLVVAFGWGGVCEQDFVFDATNHEPVAILNSCDRPVAHCVAASGCLPAECLANDWSGSSSCPVLPDAGFPEAGASEAGDARSD